MVVLLMRFRVSGFNTQPPEGGWFCITTAYLTALCFNTQPPEGGWALAKTAFKMVISVSTHSRLKAAGLLR